MRDFGAVRVRVRVRVGIRLRHRRRRKDPEIDDPQAIEPSDKPNSTSSSKNDPVTIVEVFLQTCDFGGGKGGRPMTTRMYIHRSSCIEKNAKK